MDGPIASATPWGRLPAELAPALRAELESTVHALAGKVTSAVPDFARIDDPKFEQDVHDAVRTAVQRFVELVGTDEPALRADVRDTFLALGAAEARDRRSPDILLAALRIASRLLLRIAAEALAGVRPLDTSGLLDLSDAVSAFADELAATSTEGFALQLREQASETDRRRRALAELLLRGDALESDVLAGAAGIGWRRLGTLVPVLLPRQLARDARFRYGAEGAGGTEGIVLDREHDAVLLLREGPRATRTHLAQSLRGRSAVVGPSLGWTRVPEAVRLAELTAQLVGDRSAVSDGSAGPVFVDDHLAALAVRGEHRALVVLSERRLAAFAGLREPGRGRLLETLYSWLRHWGSRTDVAAELFIHPQTVSYRVNRLRALLGDDLNDATARFELLLVLADTEAWSRGH